MNVIFQVIVETIAKAFNKNLGIIAVLLIADGGTTIVNIVLGTLQGTKNEGFDVKKFFFGIIKLLAWQVIIFWLCYFLNLAQLGLELFGVELNVKFAGINIDGDTLVSLIDVAAVIWARLKDTALDVIDKIKKQRDLKYIKYDDISPQVSEKTEEGIG